MATGRSPYLTRSRRRQQPPLSSGIAAAAGPGVDTSSMEELHSHASSESSSFTSPTFRMGQSLVQARISPVAAAAGTVSSHRPRRFFAASPRVSTTKSALSVKPTTNHHRLSLNASVRRTLPTSATPADVNTNGEAEKEVGPSKSILRPYPEGESIAATSTNANDETEELVLVDGMNLTELRRLAQNCLQGGYTTTATPSIAVFYSSLVYAKTLQPSDAFLYAQALLRDGQAKRCVRLLDQSGLLYPTASSSTQMQQETYPQSDSPSKLTTIESQLLSLEAVLLGAQALKTTEDWTILLTLLEDASQPNAYAVDGGSAGGVQGNPYAIHGIHTMAVNMRLEDDDDLAWNSWAGVLRDAMPMGRTASIIHPLARLCCERGIAYSETGHPLRAALYWKRSLSIDPKCVQALDCLLDRSIVSPEEAYKVIVNLQMGPNQEWLKRLYLARIDLSPQEQLGGQSAVLSTTLADASSIQLTTPSFQQHQQRLSFGTVSSKSFFGEGSHEPPREGSTPIAAAGLHQNGMGIETDVHISPIQHDVDDAFEKLWDEHKLNKSSQVLAMAARRAYKNYDLDDALRYCQELSTVDPLCQTASFVYVCVCIVLRKKRLLFQLAHDWVDASPKSARAWFAVGAYYYVCGRFHVAQRHFCRATRLDPHCTAAWIAFGCSFAAVDESDQALASFRAAQRLSPGEHTSMLYIGMEYLRTNHLVLAKHFLSSARTSSGGDPSCLNELGVLAYQQREYATAIRWFCKTIAAISESKVEIRTDGGTSTLKKTKGGKSDVFPFLNSGILTDENLLQDLVCDCQDTYWETTLFNLGQAYRKLRYIDLSLICLEQCLALNPDSPSTYSAIGFCRHLKFDLDGAIDYYHQALSRKPDDPFCTEMLHFALLDALHNPPKDENVQPAEGSVFKGAMLSSGIETGLQKKIQSMELNMNSSHADVSSPQRPMQNSTMMMMMSDEGPSLSLDTSGDIDMSMT